MLWSMLGWNPDARHQPVGDRRRVDAPIRLLVDVVPGSRPISGSVSVGDAAAQPFAGFLELMAVVDRAAAEPTAGIEPEGEER